MVLRFPSRPIRSDREHARATELIGCKSDRDTGDYLDTLILLVNKYEDERQTVSNELTPQQALRAIMAANGLTQKELGRVIGSKSALSMFLEGERELSKSHITALAGRFRIDPPVFFELVRRSGSVRQSRLESGQSRAVAARAAVHRRIRPSEFEAAPIALTFQPRGTAARADTARLC